MKRINAEREIEVLCRVCGAVVETPVRRWLGCMPICRRCAENHADIYTPLEEDTCSE